MQVTIQQVAPVSEITADELARIVSLVRGGCTGIAPFAVTSARAQAWQHGIVCPIRLDGILHALWQVTTTGARQVTGTSFETRLAVYHPHLSLAYSTGHVDQDPIRAWLSNCDAPEIPFPVAGLVLVTQQHNGREITFRVLDRIPLTG